MTDKFTCKECGEVVKITDFDYKDANLYFSLKESLVCEECARGVGATVVRIKNKE